MAMSVMERSSEIGVLRALGWPKRRIVRMILIESELLSLVGAAAGSIAAIAVVGFLGRLPTTSGLIDGRLTPRVVGLGFAVSIGVGLIGGCYSAYLAARLLPAKTLRHEKLQGRLVHVVRSHRRCSADRIPRDLPGRRRSAEVHRRRHDVGRRRAILDPTRLAQCAGWPGRGVAILSIGIGGKI